MFYRVRGTFRKASKDFNFDVIVEANSIEEAIVSTKDSIGSDNVFAAEEIGVGISTFLEIEKSKEPKFDKLSDRMQIV